MAQPPKPSAAETIARLEARIAAETPALDDAKARQRVALIGIEQGAAGAEEQADALAREVRERRDRIAALRDTLADARVAQAELDREAIAKVAATEREKLAASAKKCRKLAQAEDAALDSVVAARAALREGLAELWKAADGPTQSGELSELPTIINNLPMIANERLATGGVMASRSANFDRSAPPRSVAEELDKVLDLIAPGPGRPKKLGDEGTAA